MKNFIGLISMVFIGWPDDYIGSDSMTPWIIETSVGFTDVGLFKISESVRAYAYLILSSQASGIVGNTASALTAQSAFLNNFEDIINRRVDIREDLNIIKTLSVTHRVRSITGQGKYLHVTWRHELKNQIGNCRV